MGTPAMGPATQPLPVIPTVTSTASSVSPSPGPESSPIMVSPISSLVAFQSSSLSDWYTYELNSAFLLKLHNEHGL